MYERKGRTMKKVSIIKAVAITVIAITCFYGLMTAWDNITTDKVVAQADRLGTVRTMEGYAQHSTNTTDTIISTTDGQMYAITDDVEGEVLCWLADNNTPTDYTDDVIIEVVQQRE